MTGNRQVEKSVYLFRQFLEGLGWTPKSFETVDASGKINRDVFMLKQYLSKPADSIFFREFSGKPIKDPLKNAICFGY